MPDLRDGEALDVPGSNGATYTIKNVGGVYACTCMAWRTQSAAADRRTCKHIRRLRGDAAEDARVGLRAAPPRPGKATPAAPHVALPTPVAARTLPAAVEADAIVTAYQFTTGRLTGLLCRLGDGQAVGVAAGFADRDRDCPPPVGAIVGLRFRHLSATGVPVGATFAGARPDDAPARPLPAHG